MSGEPVGFVDEVAAYFQVDVVLGDPAVYAAAHAELDALLPGGGTLAERYAAHRRREECPPDRLEAAVHALSSALRDRVRGQYGLPEVETVRYEVVTDQPWSGFNYYEGDYRSRVAINADLPHRLSAAAAPGRARVLSRATTPSTAARSAGLVERAGRTEHTVFLVNTPECLMAEGLADLGVQASVGEGWGPWAAEILGDLGLRFDGHLAERLAAAAAPLNRVRQDAAILLHDRGADADEVIAYLQRWSLVSAERAAQQIRFLTHPLWRAYISTYVEGFDLLSRWLAARPAGPAGRRPLRPAARRAAHARGPWPPSCGPPEPWRAATRGRPACSGCGRRPGWRVFLLAGLLWLGDLSRAVAGARSSRCSGRWSRCARAVGPSPAVTPHPRSGRPGRCARHGGAAGGATATGWRPADLVLANCSTRCQSPERCWRA